MAQRPRPPDPDQLPLPLGPGNSVREASRRETRRQRLRAWRSSIPASTLAQPTDSANGPSTGNPPPSLAPPVAPLEPATARLSELIPRFVEYSAAIDRSDYTLDALRLDLMLLTRFLGDAVGRDIGLDDLRRYTLWLRIERRNDARSLRRKVASVKAFFSYLAQIGVRDDDPSNQLLYPSLEPHVPEFLESHEADRVLAAAEHLQWRALVLILLDVGLKRDEALGLHPADISIDPGDPTHGSLVIRDTDLARRIRARMLPLTPRLADALGRHLAVTPGDRVFPISVRAVNFIVETCGERAGLRKRGKVSPQMLRDTFAMNETRRRVAIERQRRADGATVAELTALYQNHNHEICDLLGLTPGETNDPIARYRLLC